MLVNAKNARNIPGRKTDVADAQWLAQLAAHGLLRASFVPPETSRPFESGSFSNVAKHAPNTGFWGTQDY